MRLPARLVSWLLHRANAHVGVHREFYDLKDRLLRQFGRRAGEDAQHIVDRCWGDHDTACGPTCRRCRGTGIYRERLILLERWNLAGRIFHRPDRTVSGPGWWPTIEGRITHDDIGYPTAAEARLWLALLFDRRLWWRELIGSRFCGWQWRPMLALQAVAFPLRMFASRFGFGRSRCSCGRRVIRPFAKSYFFICLRCERERRQQWAAFTATDDELPF